jgi:hypothetical protein
MRQRTFTYPHTARDVSTRTKVNESNQTPLERHTSWNMVALPTLLRPFKGFLPLKVGISSRSGNRGGKTSVRLSLSIYLSQIFALSSKLCSCRSCGHTHIDGRNPLDAPAFGHNLGLRHHQDFQVSALTCRDAFGLDIVKIVDPFLVVHAPFGVSCIWRCTQVVVNDVPPVLAITINSDLGSIPTIIPRSLFCRVRAYASIGRPKANGT